MPKRTPSDQGAFAAYREARRREAELFAAAERADNWLVGIALAVYVALVAIGAYFLFGG